MKGYGQIHGNDQTSLDLIRKTWRSRKWGVSSKPWFQSQTGLPSTSGETVETWGRQATQSFGHPYRLLGRSKTNIGGKFLTAKAQVLSAGSNLSLTRTIGGSPPSTLTWRGQMYASPDTRSLLQRALQTPEQDATFVFSKCPQLSDFLLDGHGATAVARCAPTNPIVDLSSTLAELYREGLPSRPGNAGNIGGEYLNVMFGYVPLFGDTSKAIEVARNADALLQQYERDSGRWIRRTYRFPDSLSTTTTVANNQAPAANGGAPSGLLVKIGKLTTTTRTTTSEWFSGAFTYHLPQSGWRRTVAELDHLYGVQPGIDTAWELTPYSWLVDYFSNIGDVLKNINAFTADGLVMPYGYIMRSSTVDVEYTFDGQVYINNVLTNVQLYDHVQWHIKQRRPANPFGFGVADEALNARQWSILAALGISRVF